MNGTMLNDFLRNIHPDLSRYTYRMLKSLVTLRMLPLLTAEDLEKDCGVDNSVHRKLIMDAAARSKYNYVLNI